MTRPLTHPVSYHPLCPQISGLEERLQAISSQVDQLKRSPIAPIASGGSTTPTAASGAAGALSAEALTAAVATLSSSDPAELIHDRAGVEKMVSHVQLLEATMLKVGTEDEAPTIAFLPDLFNQILLLLLLLICLASLSS